jgi:uncharacterized protein YggT (Ycf19 family)
MRSTLSNRVSVGYLVGVFVTLAELLLLLRVVVNFFFTSASGSFFHWVGYTTDPLLAPLRAIFPNPTHVPGNWYVDWSALMAMALYALVAYGLVGLVDRWVVLGERVVRGSRR